MVPSAFRLFNFGLEANRDKESSKKACIKLFNQAENSIVILSGELNDEFYGDLQLCQSIRNAANRGVSVEIGYGPQASNKILESLKGFGKKHGNVRLYPLTQRPERHFMVIDAKTVRIQPKHPPGTQEHRAVIKHNSPGLALEFLNFFKSVIGKRES